MQAVVWSKKSCHMAGCVRPRWQHLWMLLIKTANNPRPVRQLCQQTQHGIEDHHLDSPGARPEVAPALSLDMSEQVIQKQEETPGHAPKSFRSSLNLDCRAGLYW